ncbi:glycosyltransferase family 4 protein [Phenylobacterium sp.]|uniref:glycosyltransferase family 4 protein n=1 Tax=Phenylobacterium sp. TaxID=1871053 RepID=UPI0027351567|nr:glycosyltransferase family 4 protein [Phenylobacterium sp.]MDP3660639.1 glycosyltransferase family 4 protein [Phenylobacterium sp.]
MRIMFWNAAFLPHIGGVEIFTARLAAGLIARGCQVAVVTDSDLEGDPELDARLGLEVFRLPFRAALDPTAMDVRARLRLIGEVTAQTAELKRAFRPEIVHVNLADAGPFFHLRTMQAHAAATVVTFQAALERSAHGSQGVAGDLVSRAQALVAVSKAAALNAAHHTGLPVERIQVIYPGVPADEFTLPPAPASEPPVFGYLGRLAEEKGVALLLQALALMGGEARLLVIGDGPDRPRLEALACELGVAQRVTFAGQVSDAERQQLMSTLRALAVPSQHEELFGMVAVEGALAQLPVVATAIGGLQEIVRPGETGFLAQRGSVEDFSKYFNTLSDDPALARRMGEAGHARALARYTIETTVERYAALYAQCVVGSDHAAGV